MRGNHAVGGLYGVFADRPGGRPSTLAFGPDDVRARRPGPEQHHRQPGGVAGVAAALDLPLAEGYAAEVVSFAAFAEYLHDPLTPEGQSALRLLRMLMMS